MKKNFLFVEWNDEKHRDSNEDGNRIAENFKGLKKHITRERERESNCKKVLQLL